ncbi:MAG: hypothetical protein A2729_00330 [Candidatus Buchananbacteria bacterium RIFCSPHIGHO2_01_FULL_39_14]|uniref:Uncharacterized protein n=3 Tax=Parcubacteria group TaxID=1794811 RepID=A0A1F6XVY4_9BACT|nr:MAG: hypothetical protein A3H53_02220 [Candidatus Nomurabacteria bacterium RIFCSPLOWO2_02_FULL_40_10]OGY45275.1 MAG: hypothetical protein A2729_00330 [Candidatus Buchananbacteria bacterium RIFCSPHIGHO2_01_FULL_39_14]OGY48752.1 MAG: hypothetical protein A3D39_04775 [Candidatus Buchananbacteria bacterium RIFCSPHIGHO2_02_FULL_39_17]OGY53524.1 MAG: hypothetical protein A2912_06085 [Candidatus Buchananbacteria bacterium RIFCSPLOWO2_01_FULL_40_23b]
MSFSEGLKANGWLTFVSVLFAVGLYYFSLPAIIAGAVYVFVKRESQILGFGEKSMKFSSAFLGALAVAIIVQVILQYLFGINLRTLGQTLHDFGIGGLFVGEITGLMFKQVLALVITGLIFNLWYTRKTESRKLKVLMVVVCFGYFSYHAFDQYAPLSQEVKTRTQSSWTNFRHDFNDLLEAWRGSWGKNASKEAALIDAKSEMPIIKVVFQRSALWQHVSPKFDPLLDEKGEPRYAEKGDQVYVKASERERSKEGILYLRVILTGDNEVGAFVKANVVVNRLPEETPKVITPVAAAANSLSAAQGVYTQPVPQPAIDLSELARPLPSAVMEDVVIANSTEWTDSEVIPHPGESIQFGRLVDDKFAGFEDVKEVEKILARVGGRMPVALRPVARWDGTYIAEVSGTGGANTSNAPLRLKVNDGSPLSVAIRKVKSY